jgi:hypothetical protein
VPLLQTSTTCEGRPRVVAVPEALTDTARQIASHRRDIETLGRAFRCEGASTPHVAGAVDGIGSERNARPGAAAWIRRII